MQSSHPQENDLVLCNGVTMYFPSANYLLKTMQLSAEATRDGGVVIFGDIQSRCARNPCTDLVDGKWADVGGVWQMWGVLRSDGGDTAQESRGSAIDPCQDPGRPIEYELSRQSSKDKNTSAIEFIEPSTICQLARLRRFSSK